MLLKCFWRLLICELNPVSLVTYILLWLYSTSISVGHKITCVCFLIFKCFKTFREWYCSVVTVPRIELGNLLKQRIRVGKGGGEHIVTLLSHRLAMKISKYHSSGNDNGSWGGAGGFQLLKATHSYFAIKYILVSSIHTTAFWKVCHIIETGHY